jgi:Cu+-exporting ATPase
MIGRFALDLQTFNEHNHGKGENHMATSVKDSVCGMDIDSAIVAGKSEYKGQTYYFCSLGWKKAFDKDPKK